MGDKTRQAEPKTHILEKSSIIEDRFPVCVITLHMRKTHAVAGRAISMIKWIFRNIIFHVSFNAMCL